LRQRNTLPVVVQHILNVHGDGRDVQNTVAAVNDVAFDRNEYVLTLGEKDFLGLAGLVGEAEKFQVDGRGRLNNWWSEDWTLIGGAVVSRDHYWRRPGDKDIPCISCILDLLALAKQVEIESGV